MSAAPPSADAPSDAVVLFDGRDIAPLQGEELRRLRRRFQMVFQDPMSSLDPRQSVESLLFEGMKAHGIVKDEKEAAPRLKQLLVGDTPDEVINLLDEAAARATQGMVW